MPSGWAHLDNVWGVAGGLRPVQNITKQMELLLKEYLLSRDIQEAQRCIIALEVPHFHHELVYEVTKNGFAYLCLTFMFKTLLTACHYDVGSKSQ